jgi:hypothetical protein
MKLIPAPAYSIRLATPPSDDIAPLSEIMIGGMPTGKIIGGAVLEAALRWDDFTLMFLTNDIPFEDTLHIYLLDDALNIVDSARLGAMYATGIFGDLDLTQSDTVRFRFFGGIVWTLLLLPKETFVLPFLSDPRGVGRPFRFSRRFQLYGKPLPDTPQKTALTPQRRPAATDKL